MHYRADGDVRLVPLDDLTAIYHRASGQTHIVGEPVPQMLALLGGDSLTVTELLDALARDHGVEVNADSEAALQARLGELCASGLVWRA